MTQEWAEMLSGRVGTWKAELIEGNSSDFETPSSFIKILAAGEVPK